MTTSSSNHRHNRPATRVAVAATGLVGALLTGTFNSASAFPGDPPTVVGRGVHTTSNSLERACFIAPLTWNEALDGPLPRCYTDVP